MLKLSRGDFEEVRLWVHRNAREIELALWRYYFENGSKEDVVSALAFYQNGDGGFGHALESDNWNPDSSPYQTLTAMAMMDRIGYSDTKHIICTGIFRYLDSGSYSNENGWLFSIPSNDDYPHAPWWTYDAKANTYESIGVTAEIAAYILKYGDKATPLYQKALKETTRILGLIGNTEKNGDMGIGGFIRLLDAINRAGLTDHYDISDVSERVRALVKSSIGRDTSKWEFYGVRPSNYITSPDSVYFDDNRDIVETELDYLIETRPKGGVWGITWSWFDNNEKYAKAFAISENWWKANLAVGKLLMLCNFGRLEI
jgi:hypothetical protein